MAANKVEKGSLRKKSGVKNSLGNPYVLTWPTVERQVCDAIVNEIKSKFPSVLSRKSLCKARRKQLESTDKEALTEEDKVLIEQMEEKQNLRKCLAVGINEVTRGLERDDLKLVLVCRSVKPSMVTDHLMLLGATRQVPILGLYDLGPVLGPLLQCNKTAALGFKKQDKETVFDSLVEVITPMVPDINVPWLKPFDNQENGSDKQMGAKRRHSGDSGTLDDGVVNKKQKVKEDVKLNENKLEQLKEKPTQSDQEFQDQKKKDSQGFAAEKLELNKITKNKEGITGQDLRQDKSHGDIEPKSELEKVRISFEPVIIKQITPNPNKKRTDKRKKKKTKTK